VAINAKNQNYHYIVLILVMTLWGGGWPITKTLVASAPPFTINFFRFAIASIFFLPTLFLYKGTWKIRYSKTTLFWFLLLGVTGICGYGVFFVFGLKYTTAAQGSIIAGTNPAFISIFAHLFHGERLRTKWQYSGFVISFSGVLFVIGVQALINFNKNYLMGNLLIVCAMLCWGIYTNIGKKVMKSTNSLEATTGAVFFGMILFGISASFEDVWQFDRNTLTNQFWLGVLYLGGLATFLGFRFYFSAVRSIGATNSSIFINLVPIFGTLFSFLFLDETIYWTFLVGLFLIIVGIIIINYPAKNMD
jgi:drug/metabolite transporter (DMT)-like permease